MPIRELGGIYIKRMILILIAIHLVLSFFIFTCFGNSTDSGLASQVSGGSGGFIGQVSGGGESGVQASDSGILTSGVLSNLSPSGSTLSFQASGGTTLVLGSGTLVGGTFVGQASGGGILISGVLSNLSPGGSSGLSAGPTGVLSNMCGFELSPFTATTSDGSSDGTASVGGSSGGSTSPS